MKRLFLLLLLSSTYYGSIAQTTKRTSGLGIGLEAGLPVGENGRIYSFTLGGSLQYESRPASDVGITLSGGYLTYRLKSAIGPGGAGFVPLLAGVKYYFVPNAFFHAQLGAAIGTASGQGTSFAYTPGVGAVLSRNIDATLKYMGISNKGGTLDNVALRVGINF